MTSLPPNESPAFADSSEKAPESFPLVPLLLAVFAYLFLYALVASTEFMPFLQDWGRSALLLWFGFGLSLGPFTLLQALLVRYLTAWRGSWIKKIGAILLAGLVWAALLEMASSSNGPAGEALGILLGPWINLALIATTSLIGAMIALAIREAAVMIPVLAVSAMVDYWGVYYGTTHLFMQNAPHVVEKVSAKVPVITFGGIPQPPPTIGPGDFVFLGIFFACLYRFNLNVNRTFWAFFFFLLGALLLVTFFSFPIPGLVPMALAMLLVNHRELRMSRSEAFATAYVLLAIAALLAALTFIGPFQSQPSKISPPHKTAFLLKDTAKTHENLSSSV